MTVLIAPNAYKGSLAAPAVAGAMAEGVRQVLPDASVRLLPLADGGDGSVDAFVASGFAPVPVTVRGPTGEPVHATIALRTGHAVVELADACGMARLPGGLLAPMTSTTLGLGDAMLAALDEGATRITVCLGGSASTDGGAGLLVALGARLLDVDGRHVDPGGRSLASITHLDLSELDPRLADVAFDAAVDVTSPLYGPTGAAAVFAPQKGATPDEVAQLDAGLRAWASTLHSATGRDVSTAPGSGAAGGTAAALMAVLGAHARPGAALIAGVVGLDEAIDESDLVITGEGRLDEQTALGKGAIDVASRCRAAGRDVIAVCGQVALDDEAMVAAGFAAWDDCLSHAVDADDAERRAAELVATATAEALRRWRP